MFAWLFGRKRLERNEPSLGLLQYDWKLGAWLTCMQAPAIGDSAFQLSIEADPQQDIGWAVQTVQQLLRRWPGLHDDLMLLLEQETRRHASRMQRDSLPDAARLAQTLLLDRLHLVRSAGQPEVQLRYFNVRLGEFGGTHLVKVSTADWRLSCESRLFDNPYPG